MIAFSQQEINLRYQKSFNGSEKIRVGVAVALINLENKILLQEEKIKKFDVDKEELEFLRFNLSYGHKCRKSFFNSNGFIVGTADYKKCVLNKGNKN